MNESGDITEIHSTPTKSDETSIDLLSVLNLIAIPYGDGYIKIGDNLLHDSNHINIMLPGITTNGPYAYGDIYKSDKTIEGTTVYGGKSPFTSTLEEIAGGNNGEGNVRTIQFNYPDKASHFDIDSYLETILEYIETNGTLIKGKNITLYGQSLGGKAAIYLAGKIIEKGGKLDNLILYAPALKTNILISWKKLINKVPVIIGTLIQKKILGQIRKKQVINSDKDPYLELSTKDLPKLAIEASGENVLRSQMRDRLKFITIDIEKDHYFTKSIKHINRAKTNITILLSDIGNGTDGLFVNSKLKNILDNLFPNKNIKYITIKGLPHVSLPQTARFHSDILKKLASSSK